VRGPLSAQPVAEIFQYGQNVYKLFEKQ